MNLTVTISALLLGGWVLPSLEPGESPESLGWSYQSSPRAEAPAPQRPAAPLPSTSPRPPMSPGPSERPAQDSLYGRSQAPPAPEAPQQMPVAPTEMAGPQAMPMAPTEAAPNIPMQRQGATFAPTSPMSQPSLQQPRYRPGQVNRVQRRNVTSPGVNMVDKPFSTYRPQPAVSPYLNLFRSGGGLANNYFNLVQPRMEQRAESARTQHKIRQLEQSTRRQGQALEDMSRQAEGGVIVTPQFSQPFQNGYVPPFSR